MMFFLIKYCLFIKLNFKMFVKSYLFRSFVLCLCFNLLKLW